MAKKQLSRDQKRKQKKQKRVQRQAPAASLDPTGVMMQRLKKAGLDRYEVMRNPPGHEKMSEVLMDFIRPYYHIATTTSANILLNTTGRFWITNWLTGAMTTIFQLCHSGRRERTKRRRELVMSLIPFVMIFPEQGERETRTIPTRGHSLHA